MNRMQREKWRECNRDPDVEIQFPLSLSPNDLIIYCDCQWMGMDEGAVEGGLWMAWKVEINVNFIEFRFIIVSGAGLGGGWTNELWRCMVVVWRREVGHSGIVDGDRIDFITICRSDTQ